MSNRWMAALPGLLIAGALAARNQGMFGGNQQALAAGLSPKDLSGNNAGWANMSQGLLPNGEANPAMQRPQMEAEGPPMPGADMAAQAAQREQQQAQRRAIAQKLPQPGMQNPAQPYQMPNGLAGGMAPPLLAGAGAGMPAMMAQRWAYPSSMYASIHGQPEPSMAFSTDRQPAPLPMFASLPQRGLI